MRRLHSAKAMGSHRSTAWSFFPLSLHERYTNKKGEGHRPSPPTSNCSFKIPTSPSDVHRTDAETRVEFLCCRCREVS